MAESEGEDDFPNDFDGLDFNNIPGLQAPLVSIHAPQSSDSPLAVPLPSGVASPVPSNGSSGVEDMDASFLAAVDALEARALSEMHRDIGSLSCAKPGGCVTDDNTYNTVTDSSQSESSVNKKGKRKAESQEDRDVKTILEGYEVELTCPICCDLFVGAQVANPCGHSCCGECGYGWLTQNKYDPTCAVCRSSLTARNPLLPNFSVDNLVRQHLQALARSGRPEWQERGYRAIEWNKRLESWKKQAAARAKEKSKETGRARRRQPRYYQVDEYPYTNQWVIDESMDDDDAAVIAVMPRRGTRSRR